MQAGFNDTEFTSEAIVEAKHAVANAARALYEADAKLTRLVEEAAAAVEIQAETEVCCVWS